MTQTRAARIGQRGDQRVLRAHRSQRGRCVESVDCQLNELTITTRYKICNVAEFTTNSFREVLGIGPMTAVVQAHIDEQTVKDAEAVLRPMGFTTSEVVRLLIVRIAKDKALPFEPFEPNETTIEAMKAARRGELVTVGNIEGLFADLHADD